jgi:hypothetical protein
VYSNTLRTVKPVMCVLPESIIPDKEQKKNPARGGIEFKKF